MLLCSWNSCMYTFCLVLSCILNCLVINIHASWPKIIWTINWDWQYHNLISDQTSKKHCIAGPEEFEAWWSIWPPAPGEHGQPGQHHVQQLMFNINQLIVMVEAGQGNTIPMLLLESKLSGEVRSRSSVTASTQLEMAHYNSKFTLCKLVIEPMTGR